MLNCAVEWGMLESAPKIKRLKCNGDIEVDFLSFEDAEHLIDAAEKEWKALFVTALKTGLRRGELLALRWQDVNLDNRKLVVRQNRVHGKTETPKNHKPRTVPLAESVVEALAELKGMREPLVFCREAGGHLVFSKKSGDYLSVKSIHRILSETCARAEIRHIGWHACRHTFASHLVMKGVPLKVVQELLGHATIDMTMRYSHLSPSVKDSAVQLLDQPIR